jgi:hypothetical protein
MNPGDLVRYRPLSLGQIKIIIFPKLLLKGAILNTSMNHDTRGVIFFAISVPDRAYMYLLSPTFIGWTLREGFEKVGQ